MNINYKIIIALSFTLCTSCTNDNNETIPDMNVSDMKTEDINATDSASDMACKNVRGYTIDLAIPCKKFEKPDKEFGCLPCSDAFCSGVAAQGCYLSSDESVVIFSETVSAPYDALLDMGWTFCSEKTVDGENLALETLPTCQ